MQSNKSNGALTAQISVNDHPKSGFDLSNNVLGTGKIGRIIPTRALHVMPGDTIKQDSKAVVQFEPLAVPILANMDVKQEHFYVPYNIVWRNWDKFISGGEKLDYNGVVPNTSMRKILEVVCNEFGLNAIKIAPTPPLNEEGYLDMPASISMAESLKLVLSQVAEELYVKDLFAPQYKVLEMLKYIEAGPLTYPNNHDFVLVQGYGSEIGAYQSFVSYMEEQALTGNKYLEEIKPAILAEMQYNNVWLPTQKGFDRLQLIYEYVKPLVGLGSNIDYLNMARLTLSELIYMVSMNITQQYLQYEGEFADFQVDFDLGSKYAVNQPMTILNLRANYNIWFNNYRDILLEDDAFVPVDEDEISDTELFVLLIPRQRCWEKDAFTTALDNPGTGNVGVPISQSAVYSQIPNTNVNSSYKINTIQDIGSTFVGQDAYDIDPNMSNVAQVTFDGNTWNLPTAYLTGVNSEIDLTTFSQDIQGFSLYALDAAQRAQKWLQKALFFGNRISDFYYMHFGVRYLDARLRLPELLTSSSELVNLDVVMNNTPIPSENVIAGDRSAYASAYDNGNSFDRFCEEHGVIMSYLTIMPQVTYAYGMSRDYSRIDQFDYAFAEFATLGMDAVYDTEITNASFATSASPIGGINSQVFGYQGKYYDYKAKHSEEHGELLDTQDMYTFARKFNMFDPNGRPKLNYEFVHCFPSLDMFVVDSPLADYFRYDIRHSTAAERNLPSQSIYI